MYFNNAEWLLSRLYPSLTWSKRGDEAKIYLTFDDGPVSGITEWVLDELKKYKAKASFFAVGDNAVKNPTIIEKIITEGHTVGNHTYNHLNGWKSNDENYIENIIKCEKVLNEIRSKIPGYSLSNFQNSRLFRPPYGKIKKSQIKHLRKDYRIIMWDVLTGDFNINLAPEKCLSKAIKYSRPGSIVIFHDSVKAEANLRYVLPRYLEHFASKGFTFEAL